MTLVILPALHSRWSPNYRFLSPGDRYSKQGWHSRPVAAMGCPRLSEGLALNKDGTFWMSDKYGLYIYLLSSKCKILKLSYLLPQLS